MVDRSWGALCENMQSRSAPADVSWRSDCSHIVSGKVFAIIKSDAGKESSFPAYENLCSRAFVQEVITSLASYARPGCIHPEPTQNGEFVDVLAKITFTFQVQLVGEGVSALSSWFRV